MARSEPLYQCQECGAAALVTADAIIRQCAHTGGIVANARAATKGTSHAGIQLAPKSR